MARVEGDAGLYHPTRPILCSLAADSAGNVQHSEKGEVFCRCPATGAERPMAFQSFEAERGTLKYRSPAAEGRAVRLRDAARRPKNTGGWCASIWQVPPGGCSRRRPRAARRGCGATTGAARWRGSTRAWTGASASRNPFVRDRCRAKMTTRLGLAVAVMMAVVLGAVQAGWPERMRSLLDPGLPQAA